MEYCDNVHVSISENQFLRVSQNSNKYKHLFFDLDKTIWDFDKNSVEALNEIFNTYQLFDLGISDKEKYIKIYKIINDNCWTLYRQKKITRDELRIVRFKKTLEYFKIKNNPLAEKLAESYFELSSNKTNLTPNCRDILEYLFPNYQMHIITNGFEEAQHKKIANSGLNKFFKNIFTSEKIGCAKPDPLIFKYALQATGASFKESLMIGDDWNADVNGAKNVYMDQVYYHNDCLSNGQDPTYHIGDLTELKIFL